MKDLRGGFLRGLGLATLLCLVLGATGMVFAARWLRTGEEPGPADAIVLLGGQYSRPLYGADLYARGLAPVVYVSRPVQDPVHAELVKVGVRLPVQEEVYEEILLRKGVPPEAIRFFGRDMVSTLEEAEVLRNLLGPAPVRLLVVTSPSHTRRARIIFEKTLPTARIQVAGSPYEAFPDRWWTDFRAATAVVLETAKIGWMLVGPGFRSTDPAPAAPAR